MSKAYYFSVFVMGVFNLFIMIILAGIEKTSHIIMSTQLIPLILLWISHKNLGVKIKNRNYDERAKHLNFKSLAISGIVFIAVMIILHDLHSLKIASIEIKNILGMIIIPVFTIIFGITGFVVVSLE